MSDTPIANFLSILSSLNLRMVARNQAVGRSYDLTEIDLLLILSPDHDWKRRYAASYMSVCMEFVFSARPPLYEDLIKLDKRLCHTPTPTHLRCPVEASDTTSTWSIDPLTAYKQYAIIGMKEGSKYFPWLETNNIS